MRRFKDIMQKVFFGWMAGVMLVSSFLFIPQSAHAQLTTLNPDLVPFETKDEIEEAIQKPLAVALIQILLNLISFVANRLAYDAAIAIASGGKGQSANFEYRTIEEYGQDLWGDILGESIGQLSQGLDIVGIEYNVCAPTNPLQTLNLQLGLAQAASRPEPTCSFREIQSNWEGFVASVAEDSDPNVLFEEFVAAHGRGQTELGATLTILTNTYAEAFHQDEVKTAELLQNERFKDVEDFISGNVQTPASVLQSQFQNKLDEAQGNQTEALQGALFGNEGALLQIGVSAGSVFLNTLLSQLTNKIYTGLFEPPTTGGVFNPDFINIRGRERARETFKGLLTTPIQTLDQYNVINQFVTCPGGASRGPNNCVMDTSFAAAIARAEAGEAMTVQDAIDAGLLKGDWPLISDQDPARNQDPFCYTYGYCYSNLVKMRIARVIPVGFELAAQKSGTGNLPVVTLQQAVDGFNDCNFDNPDQLLDANHPFCHLIDPNWVVKYPETQCRAQVYGQTLVAENADVRAQTCVDTPSCIAEDENGNCVGGYGYCTRERNVWRFDGDVCPAQYASCTTLTSRTGDRDSFLTNTVDFADCDADNAGCRWYRTEQTFNDNATPADPSDDFFEWVDTAPSTAFDVSSVRTYMNANVQVCDAGDAGCTELMRASVSPLNPVINASFENDADQNNVPDFWDVDANVEYRITGADSAFGTDAVLVPQSESVDTTHPIQLGPNQFVTVSMYARADDTPTSEVEMTLSFTDGTGATVVPTVSLNSTGNCTASSLNITGDREVENTYERISCTFTTPAFSTWMSIAINSLADNTLVDGVQVDEQEVTTDFRVGYGASSQSINMRVAPSYLGCTGDASDPTECSNYAPVCAPTEVGCTAYTPTNGDPTVPGIINETNLCPTECVGYDTYRQLETNFSQDVFPVYFIADSADVCTADAAGCAEFTNLDALNEGGETLAYFTDVRVCQEVAEAGGTDAVYYTWEGSDAEGFQLRTWTLKQSNVGDAPCTSFDAASGSCTDTGVGAPAGCSTHADIFLDPDCREFYDEDGDIHYRYYSDTITVDDACSPFRKTVSNATDCSTSGGVWNPSAGNCTYNIMASESTECRAADNGCRGYTGNTGNNTRIVVQEFFEDGNLNAWPGLPAAATYSNESVAAGGHSMELGTTTAAVFGTETVGEVQEGFSYIVSFWAKGSAEIDVYFEDALGDEAFFVEDLALTAGWQEYTYGPIDPVLANSTIDVETAALTFNKNAVATNAFIDNVTLREIQDTAFLIENSWVTPSTCDQTPDGVPAPQFFLGCQEYNTHRGDRVNLTGFASICREQAIGCEAFYDTQHSDSPYPQAFNLTCDLGSVASGLTPCLFNGEEVCTVLDQQSTCTFTYEGLDMPTTLSTAVTEDSEVVTRDEKVYLVDLPQYRCAAEADGCSLYGVPEFSLDNSSVEAFTTAALINNPDSYSQTLCEQGDLFCEAYSTDDGSVFYFKDPNNQKCAYSSGVTIEGTQYAGWFRDGTNEPCYYDDLNANGVFDAASELTSSYLIGGTEFGIWRNGDGVDYDGWVGTCPAEQHSCSEFVDVIDTADNLYPNGRPYYYLNNEQIDPAEDSPTETCDGLISQEEGCVGFNNNATPFTTFNTSASYIKSWHADELVNADEPFTPVDPIDCSTTGGGLFTLADGTTVDLCLSECAYPGLIGFDSGEPVEELLLGGACITDNDCGTITDDFGNDVQGTCIDHRGINTPVSICLNAENSGELCLSDADCTGTNATCEDVSDDSLAENGALGQVNDANTILKVRRDRQCSEWLACDSQLTAWDQDQGKYVSVCNSVSLCNEFSTLGSQAFCSNWVDEPIRLLDEVEYANRDVTWYGAEFSGYSVPDQFGVQDYNQLNINPTDWCVNTLNEVINTFGAATEFNAEAGTWDNGLPAGCTLDVDCDPLSTGATCLDAAEDYRLSVVHGPCATGTANGASCSVGQCSDTGLACAEDADCGTASGVFCDLSPSITRDGQCFNGICASGVDEGPLLAAQRQECRGYPEENAPFPNEIVSEWTSQGVVEEEERPTSFRPGFNNARYCALGEVCDCSYEAVEYASGTRTLYLEHNNGDEALSGICSGGEFEGLECGGDVDCQNASGSGGGVCQFKSGQNTFVGWNGFCIQHDLSININASQDKQACLLWLPVDQLEGGTDLYNKFTEAGFSIANTAYCTDTRLFVDIGVTGAYDNDGDGVYDGINPACAASFDEAVTELGAAPTGFIDPLGALISAAIIGDTIGAMEYPGEPQSAPLSCEDDEFDACWNSVMCPKNHFAIIGGCKADGNVCQDAAGPDGEARDDCPYFCVPYGSRYETDTDEGDTGELCQPPASVTSTFTVPINSGTAEIGLAEPLHSISSWLGDDLDPAQEKEFQAYGYLVNNTDFMDMKTQYSSCRVRGFEWKENDPADNTYLPAWPQSTIWSTGLSHESWQFYLGCKELAYTSVEVGYGANLAEFGNAAYTNRVLTPNADPTKQYTLNEVGFPETLGHTRTTTPEYIGQNLTSYELTGDSVRSINDASQDDVIPTPVLACNNGPTLVTATQLAVDGGSCTYPIGTDPTSTARSFDDALYSLPVGITGGADESCETDQDCGAPVNAPTCEYGVSAWACFVGCGEAALDANDHSVSSYTSPWDVSDGDAFCGAMDLGSCIPHPDPGGWGSQDYVCEKYYGHPSSSVVGEASEEDALGRSQYVCDWSNASFFDLTSWYASFPSGNPDSVFGSIDHQCDGAGGGDAPCDTNSDCGGSNSAMCLGSICSYGTGPVSDVIPELAATSTQAQAVDRLMQFFARVYAFYDFEDDSDEVDSRDTGSTGNLADSGDTGIYIEDQGGYSNFPGFIGIDDTSTGDSNGTIPNDGTPTAPQVAGVTNNCINDNCVEGTPGRFSVNGSEGRVWNALSSFLANVEFFAYPDQNQFPLRKVIVDWGDGVDVTWSGLSSNPQAELWGRGSETGSTANDNYYKARRGLNSQQQQICSPPDADVEWGRTPDSCQEGAFQFQHHYRCTPGMFAWLNAAGRSCIRAPGTNTILNSPCTDGVQCIFQPRVYMQDNWGYCTGVCDGTDCDPEASECDFEALPIILPPNPDDLDNPWVNWDGTIEVTPS